MNFKEQKIMNETNWKTTTIGVITLVLALLSIIKTFLATGTVDGATITALIAAVGAFFGFNYAKDK